MKKAKRLLALLLAMVMLLAVTACGEKESDADAEGGEEEKVFDAETVLSQLDVTEYTYYEDGGIYGDVREVYFIIKNNSQFDIRIQCELTTYDANGETIQIEYGKLSVLGAGTEGVCVVKDLSEYDSYEYELIVEEESGYTSVSDKLTYEVTNAKDQVLVTITNNSDSEATVDAHMFCFKNGQMVRCLDMRFEYGDNMVDAGEKITCHYDYVDTRQFDDYKLVVEGIEW